MPPLLPPSSSSRSCSAWIAPLLAPALGAIGSLLAQEPLQLGPRSIEIATVLETPATAEGARTLEAPTKGGRAIDAERILPRFRAAPHFLGFAGRLYHPPAGERLDPRLARRAREASGGQQTYAYVLFEERIDASSLEFLCAEGAEPLGYHPHNACAARLPLTLVERLSTHPVVRWIGWAQPDQKLHPALIGELERTQTGALLPITIDLFESELSASSERELLALPSETTVEGVERAGNPAHAAWRWRTGGRNQSELEQLGIRILDYRDEIRAYDAEATAEAIVRCAAREDVAFVEWRPAAVGFNDRVGSQIGADYTRETVRATTVTVGVIDSGFHLANGGFAGHFDLTKQAVGSNFWPGGCGSPFCDEPTTQYHGTHVLGTLCGSGTVDPELRGVSPYLGTGGANHRLFLAKGYTSAAFAVMRNAYTDPLGWTTPRPVLVSNSWGFEGCINSCTAPAYWIGSESEARIADDEVYQQNQLYLFAAGNEGGVGGTNFVPGTIGIPANAKNVLAIGMSRDGYRTIPPVGGPGSIVEWSSHGPCGDGRWKPNLDAPGCVTESTLGGTQTGYHSLCGTSMSTPAAAGVLAGAAEAFGSLTGNAALYRAWAMASSLPWQDTTASGAWGQLPAAHLNSHGMGRLSALLAHHGPIADSNALLAWGTIGTATQTFDVGVPTGTTRLVVVMTYDDPAAAAGANPAIVDDLDLYVDDAPYDPSGNVGIWVSNSGIDTVEHIVVNSPPAGVYRVKIHPYRNLHSLRWGCVVRHFTGDTTPTGTFTASPSTQFLRPGDELLVHVTAGCDSHIATNVWIDQGDHSGFSLQGTYFSLEDGLVLVDRHDANGDILLGEILSRDTRVATYRYRESSGTDAHRLLRFDGWSDNWGTRAAAADVFVDGTPPGAATAISSSTHVLGAWSPVTGIALSFAAAPDNLSGVAGYSVSFTEGGHVTPDETLDIGPVTSFSAVLPATTTGWYFNIRAVDRCGNWSPLANWSGPYYIDDVNPLPPTGLVSTSHVPGAWSNQVDVAFQWNAALDAHSGVAGYASSVSAGSPQLPGTTPTLGPVTSTTVRLTSGSTPWYFNLRSFDRVRNWSAQGASSGPYLIDTAAPTGSISIDGGNANCTSLAVSLSPSAADPLSGVQAIRLRNAGGTWGPWRGLANPIGWNLSADGGGTQTGTRRVEMEIRDVAGNVAATWDEIFYYRPPTLFGTACTGSLGLPSFTATGIPALGRSITLGIANSAAPLGALYAGISNTTWGGIALPLDLGFLSPTTAGCAVNVALDVLTYSGAPRSLSFAIPIDPQLADRTVFLQWLLLGDPSGRLLVTTRGLRIDVAGL